MHSTNGTGLKKPDRLLSNWWGTIIQQAVERRKLAIHLIYRSLTSDTHKTMSTNKTTPSITHSPKSRVRRKRPLLYITSTTTLLSLQPIHGAPPKSAPSPYTVTWNFGPEDHFFCGQAWDDYNCSTRQNCRSGKSEECAGFDRGETCFKDTPCDSAKGGGHDFSYALYETEIPTFSPTIFVGMPTMEPMTRGPTEMPTDYPIGPPPDLVWPSEEPSDHWFCGVGIDDANERCGLHCPNAIECPIGQIVSLRCIYNVCCCCEVVDFDSLWCFISHLKSISKIKIPLHILSVLLRNQMRCTNPRPLSTTDESSHEETYAGSFGVSYDYDESYV